MCITAVIAGASLLLSAVGTYTAIQSTNAQNDWDKYRAKQETKQLVERTELARIAAMERENVRAKEFNRSWSTSLAAIGASGVAEHISFFQGVGPDSLDQFNQDVRAIRLGFVSDQVANQREIAVVGYRSDVSQFNARMSNIGAVAGFMSDAMNTASFYNNLKTPPKKGP